MQSRHWAATVRMPRGKVKATGANTSRLGRSTSPQTDSSNGAEAPETRPSPPEAGRERQRSRRFKNDFSDRGLLLLTTDLWRRPPRLDFARPSIPRKALHLTNWLWSDIGPWLFMAETSQLETSPLLSPELSPSQSHCRFQPRCQP